MHGQALAIRDQSLLPDARTWQTMGEMAAALVESGMLPNAIKTPAAAVAVIQKARELGLPPMYGLSNIAVINGRPVAGAELMLALIYRDHGDQAIRVIETSDTRCTIDYKRRGWAQPARFTWSIEDAKRAGLAGKETWKLYPPAMLRARCISAVARMAFPDSIGGLYSPEEMGADVTVNDEGEVVIADPPAPVVSIVTPDLRLEGDSEEKAAVAVSPRRERLLLAWQRGMREVQRLLEQGGLEGEEGGLLEEWRRRQPDGLDDAALKLALTSLAADIKRISEEAAF